MGIQSFTPTSGGSPDKQFIMTTVMTTASREISFSGAAGTYMVNSATNQSGYVIYSDGTNKAGTPIGLALNIGFAFTTIFMMGIAGDQFTLYKVSPKSNTNVASPFSRFTIGHSTLSTSTHAFSSTALPVADVLVVGGGGGGGHHGGGGGGAGAYIYMTKYPMSAVTPVVVGAQVGPTSKGNYSQFGGIIALGGGAAGEHSGNAGGTGANGGGAGGGHISSGSSTGGSGTAAPALPFGFTYAGSYYGLYAGGSSGGNASGPSNSWALRGGGGGGANGNGSNGGNNGGGNGGAGIISPFDSGTHHNQHYCAGGRGSNHSPAGVGSNGSGWSELGYGMGGAAHHDSTPTSTHGGPGLVAYRSYT